MRVLLLERRPKPFHEASEFREARGDHLRIVDGDRRFRG